MAEIRALKAESRTGTGKGASRAVRRLGRVPGVVYGDDQPPQSISLDQREISRLHDAGTFFSTLFVLEVEGQQTRVIPREVQLDPVRDWPVHVDLLRLGAGARINVEVPVHFVNDEESPGIKRGGVLNIVRHVIELDCPTDSIPEAIEIDLTGLDIGDSIHISHIKLPDGTEPTVSDRDFTIATVAAPAALTEEEEKPAGEAVEGEEGAEGVEGAEGAEGAAAPEGSADEGSDGKKD